MTTIEETLTKLSISENAPVPETPERPPPQPSEYRIPFGEDEKWLDYLTKHGFVVVTDVIHNDEIQKSKDYVWEWLESLGSGIKRDNFNTWTNANWPGAAHLGFLQSHGGGQSKGAWYVRSLPNVKKCFENIWKTDRLLTSMDTFICWRPWWVKNEADQDWEPIVERIHCDQSAARRPGFHCVQGMCVLIDVDPHAGGLQIVPDTNTDQVQEHLRQNYGTTGDWCELRKSDKYTTQGVLLEAKAGDMILWDSRTLHGGKVGDGKVEVKEGEPVDLARLVMTVCMTPKDKATPRVLTQREQAVEKGYTLTHWPHEYVRHGLGVTGGQNIQKNYVPPELTEAQRDLLV